MPPPGIGPRTHAYKASVMPLNYRGVKLFKSMVFHFVHIEWNQVRLLKLGGSEGIKPPLRRLECLVLSLDEQPIVWLNNTDLPLIYLPAPSYWIWPLVGIEPSLYYSNWRSPWVSHGASNIKVVNACFDTSRPLMAFVWRRVRESNPMTGSSPVYILAGCRFTVQPTLHI